MADALTPLTIFVASAILTRRMSLGEFVGVCCGFVALALVSTLMPFWTWNAAQRYVPLSVISVSAYFAPVVAMALGVLLLGESVTGLQWLGTLFIVISATAETSRQRRDREGAENGRCRV